MDSLAANTSEEVQCSIEECMRTLPLTQQSPCHLAYLASDTFVVHMKCVTLLFQATFLPLYYYTRECYKEY